MDEMIAKRPVYALWLILCLVSFPQSYADATVPPPNEDRRLTPPPPPQTTDDCGFYPMSPIGGGPGTLQGVVRDARTRDPLPGVALYVCGYGQGNVRQYSYEVYAQARTVTDETGAFTIPNLPTETNQGPLTYAVIVSPTAALGSAYERRPLRDVVITDTTRLDVQLRSEGRIEGMITDEYSGRALAGVTVYSRFEAEPITLRSRLLWQATESGTDGRYTLSNLSSAEYALFYAPPDPEYIWEEYPGVPHYLNDFMQSFSPKRLAATAGTVVPDVDASLQRFAAIEGRVVTSDGHPVPDSEVSLAVDDPVLFYPFGERSHITDADGRFRAMVPNGLYGVRVRPPASTGYPCQFYFDSARPDVYPLLMTVRQPETITITIALRQPGRITGRVRYRSGRGIPTATISEWNLPNVECSSLNGPYYVQADGSFELPVLVPRTYDLTAMVKPFPLLLHIFRNMTVEVREGETVSGVDFVFPDPVYLPRIDRP